MNQENQQEQHHTEQPTDHQTYQDTSQLLPNASTSVQYTVTTTAAAAAAASAETNQQINLIPSDQSAVYTQIYLFKRRIDELYPVKKIATYSFAFLVVNMLMIVVEYSYNLPIANSRSNPYNSLLATRYIATTSFFNILYAVLALISTKYKRYFLIQLLAILFVMAFFASIIQLFLFNLVLLIIESTFEQCNITCFLVHIIKALLGFFSSFLSAILFIKIQLKFLPMLNASCSED